MKVIKIDDKNYTISLTAKELEKLKGASITRLLVYHKAKKKMKDVKSY